jgi:hypothetical protein
MEGAVLSFVKAEWKVSDTGSAHWASSFDLLLSTGSIIQLWIKCLMFYDIKKIPSELSGILDKPSLLLHVSFERVIEKM